MEQWKDINGYEGYYQVSTLGKVKRLAGTIPAGPGCVGRAKISERILKPTIKPKGYLYVTLCKDGVNSKKHVHRLVAETFIPNPWNKSEVNHKDGDKSNNTLVNLEWMTSSENHKHAFDNGLITPPVYNLSNHPIAKKVIDPKTGETWGCAKEAAKDRGYNYDHFKSMLNGRRKNKTGLQYV